LLVDDQVAASADSATTAPGGPDVLAQMADELHLFHQRSAHRETVIDRLHEENQLLRRGLRRSILEPVVADLVRLYDGLSRQARRPGGETAVFASFADDVLLALERCGVDPFTAEPGDAYTVGLRESGIVRRPLRARFHRLPDGSRDSVPTAGTGPSKQHGDQPSDRSQG
jgi:molecular chaperone GrpE